MRGNESERDAYVLVDAIKCGEKKILILGENALHPIHGGFEHLRRILEADGTVRVLLLDFNSPMYSLREDIEDARRSARIRADWLASMGNLPSWSACEPAVVPLQFDATAQNPKAPW
jgi:hypothetical protein